MKMSKQLPGEAISTVARWKGMFAHVHVAVLVQLAGIALGRMLGVSLPQAAWLGCFAGIAVCMAREVTQHEYRWIERWGHGKRANLPWFRGYQFWCWNRHSLAETTTAALAAILVAAGLSIR